jgi:class 3 adenylate cyclase
VALCAGCGRSNPPDSAFCSGCGTRLGSDSARADEIPPARPSAGSSATEAPRTHPGPAPAPPPAEIPTSFAANRYLVSRFLGAGARKQVYLARDTRLDRDVAVAVIPTRGIDEGARLRVQREAQAMGRLGDHPNIVTIYDVLDEDGDLLLVSQYMAGGDLERRLREAPDGRLSVEESVRIARELCQALEHAHARGVIHRDLKPGNVWLGEDGAVKLGDFGLAVAVDRSRLTQEGMIVGTVAYMPPEQAMGRGGEVRSDLYALGAMLYEMMTGRPPFLGDDAVAIISQHIHTPPVAPTWHNPEVPRDLEGLILALLEKDPARRPESALRVDQSLARITPHTRGTAPRPETAVEASLPRPGAGAAWGRFVGRRAEMDRLKAGLDGALSGKGSMLMLVGEPGIGKTRLAEEFGVYAGLRGAQVLIGHSYEGAVEVPYLPFVEAFRQYVRARPDPDLRKELGGGAPEIANLVSEIRQRFSDIPSSPPIGGEAERLRLFESVTEFLRNAAAASPLVLHLDDLHWSDKPSLLLLRYLARNIASERILVVGTYRDVELDRSHPLAEVLATLRREPVYERILLRGLAEDDVFGLLSALAEDEVDAEIVAARRALATALHEETEGNPFFIREVLVHLVEEGKLFREGGQWRSSVTNVSELGIPEGVREVISRRLSRLSSGCNTMLTAAAAMPAGFRWDVIHALSTEEESVLLDLLDEALAARLVHEREGSAGTYEFTHALIRQTLYEELSTPRRVLLHRRIGEALESLCGDSPGPHLAELAYHFFQAAPGGNVEKAIDYALQAGQRATTVAAYEEAVSHYERALQALELQEGADPVRRCDLLLELAEAHVRAGMHQQSQEAAGRAAEIARSLGDRERLALAALRFYGEYASGLPVNEPHVAILEEALHALDGEKSGTRSRCQSALARELQLIQPDRARALTEEALAIARELGAPTAIARACLARHQAMATPEFLEERRSLPAEAVRVCREAGLRSLEVDAHQHAIIDLLELGDAPAARAELATLVNLARDNREPNGLWWATVLQALFATLEGRIEEAERLAEEAYVRAQRLEHVGGIALYTIQIARVRSEEGRLEEQIPLLQARMSATPNPGWQSRVAYLYAELGREREAREEFDRFAADDFRDFPKNYVWLLTMTYAAEVCAFLHDSKRAGILYDLLLPYADRNVVIASAACNGPVARQLGLLSATLGRADDAVRYFESAIQMNEKMGAQALLARAQCDFARILLDRGDKGDEAKALELAGQALGTAQDIGLKAVLERALALKLEAQGVDRVDTTTSIHVLASAVQKRRPDLAPHAAPDGTVTVMFSDMEGFTAMTERLGDRRAHEVVRVHNGIVRDQLRAHGGYEVELQGDGFLLAFSSARRALDCGIAIQRELAACNRDPSDEPIRVRMGLHTGEVIRDADKFFGRSVILAARIASQAAAEEILVSSLVKELTQSAGDLRFEPGRELTLKGISEPQRVHSVLWQ